MKINLKKEEKTYEQPIEKNKEKPVKKTKKSNTFSDIIELIFEFIDLITDIFDLFD